MHTASSRLSTEHPSRLSLGAWFRVLACLTLAAVALTRLTACETTEGAGRDIEKLGDNIEDAASDAK